MAMTIAFAMMRYKMLLTAIGRYLPRSSRLPFSLKMRLTTDVVMQSSIFPLRAQSRYVAARAMARGLGARSLPV